MIPTVWGHEFLNSKIVFCEAHRHGRQFINVLLKYLNSLLVVGRTLAQKLRFSEFISFLSAQHLWSSVSLVGSLVSQTSLLHTPPPHWVAHHWNGSSVFSLSDCTETAQTVGGKSYAADRCCCEFKLNDLNEMHLDRCYGLLVALRICVKILNELLACAYLVSTCTHLYLHWILSTPSSAQFTPELDLQIEAPPGIAS